MNRTNKFVYILSLIFLLPLCAFLIINTLLSLLQTTYMDTGQVLEIALYKSDRFYLLLFLFACTIFLFYLIGKKKLFTAHVSKILHLLSLLVSLGFCIFILLAYRATACCDSAELGNQAVLFLHGDYSSFTGDGYLAHYPHQVGVIGLLEILFYFFGEGNYVPFQIINLFSILCIIECLYQITRQLFHNTVCCCIVSMLSMGLLPLFSYVTFVYGDVPGLALALGSFLLFLQSIKADRRRKWLYLLFSSICMGLSIMLKSNNMIFMAALIILLLLHGIHEKKWSALLCGILFVFMVKMVSSIPAAYYTQASGLSALPEGIPKLAWVAMGLQENDTVADGWYNGYNWTIYTNNNYDEKQTTIDCIDSISASLSYYLSNPRQGAYFLYSKFRSQWNDPGFQSQITNEWSSRHQDSYSDLYNYLVFGSGKKILEEIMNVYHFIILSSTLIFAALLIKRKNFHLNLVLLPLCIFGGYLFHVFWEAQGRYALPYFVLMIPLAGAGLAFISTRINPCDIPDKALQCTDQDK